MMQLRRMYAHLEWADRRLLALLKPAGSGAAPERPESSPAGVVRSDPAQLSDVRDVMRPLAHILAAERVWLLRLTGQGQQVQAIWPELAVAEMEALATATHAGYAQLLDSLDDSRLAEELMYTNQAGQPFRNGIGDILVHVALHGSYHRGQVSIAVSAAGGQAINTDYITFVREVRERGTA